MFYWIMLFGGRLLKKLLLSGKDILRFQQAWYLIDAVLLLLITIYLFDDLIPGQDGSVGKMIYNNVLHISGYLLVMLFLLFAMRHSWQEKMQTEAKQKALQDLQDYTHNLETMYNGLRSFKHDYINILLSMSGYIANGDLDELKQFFETKIFPTKNLIDQGDYKLNQLGNISVLEIKSLLCAKLIYAHESGTNVTIDIPDRVDAFPMDTVDLARILGIFLDNAMEAASAAKQPQIGLNIIQHETGVSIISSNCFQEHGAALHELKQSGFSTKTGHQGIGLSNAQKIINSYDNVLLETTMQHGCFTQHMELAGGKE
ncbi:MAG: GHKL domain-containing protein [Lachnospiraceae bacterium]|nr:GHKL domain-containing protein [Lachnospiraceae bacterium]